MLLLSAGTLLVALGSTTVALAAPAPLKVQASSRPGKLISDDFDNYVNGALKDWGVPGMAFAAFKVPANGSSEDVIVDFRNFGTSGNNRTVDENTIFGIGSNTKHITAAAIGVLVDQGKLNWTSRISDILPDFALVDPVATKYATLVDVLSHQTGLPGHDYASRINQSTAEVVHDMRYWRPSAEFRGAFQYSNPMFALAAHIISTVSGTPFTDFISSHFFPQLNLTSTSYYPRHNSSLAPRVSSSYFWPGNKTSVEIPYAYDSPPNNVAEFGGEGGLASTTADFVKWVSFILVQHRKSADSSSDGSSAPTAEDKILSPAAVGHLTKAFSLEMPVPSFPDLGPQMYGQGLEIQTYQNATLYGHSGGIPGFASQFFWEPNSGVGVIAFTNAYPGGSQPAYIANYRGIEELLGLGRVDWNSRFAFSRPQLNATASATGNKTQLTPSELKRYVGKYYDRGYGAVSVCPPPSANRTSASEDCERLYERLDGAVDLDAGVEGQELPTAADLYVTFERIFSTSHILLTKTEGDDWGFTGLAKAIYGPTESRDGKVLSGQLSGFPALARFVLEDGVDGDKTEGSERKVKAMEWGGSVWDAGDDIADAVENEVQVRFDKV